MHFLQLYGDPHHFKIAQLLGATTFVCVRNGTQRTKYMTLKRHVRIYFNKKLVMLGFLDKY